MRRYPCYLCHLRRDLRFTCEARIGLSVEKWEKVGKGLWIMVRATVGFFEIFYRGRDETPLFQGMSSRTVDGF